MALKRVRRRGGLYSKGELNRLVDDLLHPLAKGEAEIPFLILDEALHALIEQNPPETLAKFLKYTLPRIISKYRKTVVKA